MTDESTDLLARAAEAVSSAEALLITAGAGMGVDSGLPDFRGNEGFWRAYPPLKGLGISFIEMANPAWFERDPTLAWGFYGHRLNLYRRTKPHPGFNILRRWAEGMRQGAFVFTSNVDGHFQRAGFADDAVLECHGSINHLQCHTPCCFEIWDGVDTQVEVDEKSFRASEPHPECPHCSGLARPNVLMFGDYSWVPARTGAQERNFARWFEGLGDAKLVTVEMGAGTAVPTVRYTSERAAQRSRGALIRVNPREAHGPSGTISISGGALETLEAIEQLL